MPWLTYGAVFGTFVGQQYPILMAFSVKSHFSSLFNSKNIKTTWWLLAASAILVVLAVLLGIADNLPAILILLAGVILFVTGFVHTWSKIRSFLYLSLTALIAFPVLVVLHNAFWWLTAQVSEMPWLAGITGFFHAITFLIAVILCPVALVVGLSGAMFLFVKKRKSPSEVSSE